MTFAFKRVNIGPGDYDVPHLVGNKGIAYSHIKTPPHYTFSKTFYVSRDLNRTMSSIS
jgi:hypothetical protein